MMIFRTKVLATTSIALFLTLLTLSPSLHATITFGGASGASGVNSDSNLTSPIIYGGTGGLESDCDPAPTTSSTCNNCGVAGAVCNRNRIHSDLDLTITFKSDAATGTPVIYYEDNDIASGTLNSAAQGSNASISIAWGDLCNELTDDSGCAINAAKTIRIGIRKSDETDTSVAPTETATVEVKIHTPGDPADSSVNGTIDDCDTSVGEDGLCIFTAHPGDKKIYLEDAKPPESSSFPQHDDLGFTHVRIFYSTESFAAVTTAQTDAKDIALEDETDKSVFLENAYIDGLENDTYYFFRIAVVDPAGNVAYLTSDLVIDADAGCQSSWTLADLEADDNLDLDCEYVARPGEVVGLLTEDLNCFISTAAFGSSMASKVSDFRRFRNRILLPRKWGRVLNKWYYQWGPRAAQFVNAHPNSKPIVRVLLWPAWAWSQLALKFGLNNTLLGTLLSLASLFGLLLLISKLGRRHLFNESN